MDPNKRSALASSFAGDCGTIKAMVSKPRSYERKEKQPPRPLDARRLNDLALHYVARFATSAAKLEDYLKRKLRERGWEGGDDPDLRALTEKFVEAGYIDDAAYARTKSGTLLRRGYGARRVTQALTAAGIGEAEREAARAGVKAHREAALTMARKRRFGPYGPALLDRPARERQIAAMLRAGHPLDSARTLIDASDQTQAELWAEQDDDGA